MKKTSTESPDPDMRAEYDFSGGVRGKYAKQLREEGYTIRIFNEDGSYSERQVLGEKMVVIEPDVWEYFPDSEAVNHALRTLIALVPSKSKVTSQSGESRTHTLSAKSRRKS
jgi:hypothetical protein